MHKDIERRLSGAVQAQVRAEGEATTRTLVGHAALFDSPYDVGNIAKWGFREIIAPGAFAAAIAEQQDVRALWNHDESQVLGRTRSGTLKLAEDARGLAVEIALPDTQLGRDLGELVRRGDVSQMSFGFVVREETWGTVDGVDVRRITRADLFDVSPVTYPANVNTEIALRGATARALEERQRAADVGAAQMRTRRLVLLGLE